MIKKTNRTDFSTYQYHPLSEQLVKIIESKTQTENTAFFRINVAYFIAKLASTMRTNILHANKKTVVNVYAINLAPSGAGKGHSKDILEENIIEPFKKQFMDTTYKTIGELSLRALAKEAVKNADDDEDAEYDKLRTEFFNCGPFMFSYSEASVAAVKQMREKLLMAGSGAMSLEIDEISHHIEKIDDVIATYLELYDVGKLGKRMIKHTSDQKRNTPLDGRTPANLLLFGTPSVLLNDPKKEKKFEEYNIDGLGRRSLYGFTTQTFHKPKPDAVTAYDQLHCSKTDDSLNTITQELVELANEEYFGMNLKMSRDTGIFHYKYRTECENRAQEDYTSFQEMLSTEMAHRHSKVLKLAGAYAWIDKATEVTIDHIKYAIRLVEDSGEAYARLLTRDQPYVRLAHFIAEAGRELTIVDMMENLPFFKGNKQVKTEMLSLAITYGLKNNIVIKRSYIDDIAFYTGETLELTDLNRLTLSYSEDSTLNFTPIFCSYDDLDQLIIEDQLYWTVHHFADNYRIGEKAIPGFNMLVLDVDENTSLSTAQLLLKEFKYKIYTTKRHTDDAHRFRIILPLTHTLRLNRKEYVQYMNNVFEWLPFFSDEATKDISRKWATNKDAIIINNDGDLLDATLFIPKTKTSENIKKRIHENTNMSHLENWFVRETEDGNRSHMYIKYALCLVDAGFDIVAIREKIDNFNTKVKPPLSDDEINQTIMRTVAKKLAA